MKAIQYIKYGILAVIFVYLAFYIFNADRDRRELKRVHAETSARYIAIIDSLDMVHSNYERDIVLQNHTIAILKQKIDSLKNVHHATISNITMLNPNQVDSIIRANINH